MAAAPRRLSGANGPHLLHIALPSLTHLCFWEWQRRQALPEGFTGASICWSERETDNKAGLSIHSWWRSTLTSNPDGATPQKRLLLVLGQFDGSI
jgi:hypothetical protein